MQKYRKYAITKLIFENFSPSPNGEGLRRPFPNHIPSSLLPRIARDLPSAQPGNKADLGMYCLILWSGAATAKKLLKLLVGNFLVNFCPSVAAAAAAATTTTKEHQENDCSYTDLSKNARMPDMLCTTCSESPGGSC